MMKIVNICAAIMFMMCVSFSTASTAHAAEPVDPVKVFKKGMAAFNKSEYGKAEKLFDEAVKLGLKEPYRGDVIGLKRLIETCTPANGPATKTWLAFSSALKKKDYAAAYKLMSKAEQSKMSFEKFKYDASRPNPAADAARESLKPGKEEKIDKDIIELHFCRNHRPKVRTIKVTRENGSWLLVN